MNDYVDFDVKMPLRLRAITPLVKFVLSNAILFPWTVSGLGMMRTYITETMKIHVWHSSLLVENVTLHHNHPWAFESTVIAGKVMDSTFTLHDDVVEMGHIYREVTLDVGKPGGNNMIDEGRHVWLVADEPTTLNPGDSYKHKPEDIHFVNFVDGSVTLIDKHMGDVEDHAKVYVPTGEKWVDAKPRKATPSQAEYVARIALTLFD